MKGMQKGRFRQQQGGAVSDLESTGFEVQPIHVLFGTVAFVLTVILLHFYGKFVGK
ncbi:GPI-anchored surface protein, putative [Bodo saltans]|uniref:GPI-anchored surface protein, putative n=1 Tax=Bodo saltans TaxID=75058 RepID=A0A0S4JMF7_BODSA|nr:GPI-anchored surface protein, putative [Bodo saltans]|eukprot:CUG92695.1 GPI-anchored surface protein, putative [Bodo saltans]